MQLYDLNSSRTPQSQLTFESPHHHAVIRPQSVRSLGEIRRDCYECRLLTTQLHNSESSSSTFDSSNTCRPALLNRADVEANAERRITLEYNWPGRDHQGGEGTPHHR
jgi:hypothetical protein